MDENVILEPKIFWAKQGGGGDCTQFDLQPNSAKKRRGT